MKQYLNNTNTNNDDDDDDADVILAVAPFHRGAHIALYNSTLLKVHPFYHKS